MTEAHNPVTGEIVADDSMDGIEARSIVAADGGLMPKRSGHLSDVLRMLEDGQFNADVSIDMRELAEALEAHAHNNKGQAKGKLSLTFDFHLANGVLVITPNHTVKKPVQKRIGTALFVGEDGSLGRNPPGQRPMFGSQAPRDPYEAREVRDA